MKWSRKAALAIAVALVYVTPVFAATIEIGQALSGGLQDIINGVVTAALAALVGWVLMTVKNKFNIDIEAKHRDALTAFVQRQASGLVAKGAVKLDGVKIDVKSEFLAGAANAAVKAIPDALEFFGITEADLQRRIVDLIPQQPAVAQAAAVAIDTANPQTPSGKPAA